MDTFEKDDERFNPTACRIFLSYIRTSEPPKAFKRWSVAGVFMATMGGLLWQIAFFDKVREHGLGDYELVRKPISNQSKWYWRSRIKKNG